MQNLNPQSLREAIKKLQKQQAKIPDFDIFVKLELISQLEFNKHISMARLAKKMRSNERLIRQIIQSIRTTFDTLMYQISASDMEHRLYWIYRLTGSYLISSAKGYRLSRDPKDFQHYSNRTNLTIITKQIEILQIELLKCQA